MKRWRQRIESLPMKKAVYFFLCFLSLLIAIQAGYQHGRIELVGKVMAIPLACFFFFFYALILEGNQMKEESTLTFMFFFFFAVASYFNRSALWFFSIPGDGMDIPHV